MGLNALLIVGGSSETFLSFDKSAGDARRRVLEAMLVPNTPCPSIALFPRLGPVCGLWTVGGTGVRVQGNPWQGAVSTGAGAVPRCHPKRSGVQKSCFLGFFDVRHRRPSQHGQTSNMLSRRPFRCRTGIFHRPQTRPRPDPDPDPDKIRRGNSKTPSSSHAFLCPGPFEEESPTNTRHTLPRPPRPSLPPDGCRLTDPSVYLSTPSPDNDRHFDLSSPDVSIR